MSELRVTMRHVREKSPRGCGWCTRGTKDWFDAHGMNFRDFLQHGLPIESLEAMDDPFAQRIAKFVREKMSKEPL